MKDVPPTQHENCGETEASLMWVRNTKMQKKKGMFVLQIITLSVGSGYLHPRGRWDTGKGIDYRSSAFKELLYITGRFIMFFVITNICNKKTKGPTLMELFTVTGKQKKFFFWQLEFFDVCTTSDTAHIDKIFKLLPHTRQRVWQQLEYLIDLCRVTCGAHIEQL